MTRKTLKTNSTPQTIADADLEQASGGLIGLLVPAVKKSPGATSPKTQFHGGVTVGAGDIGGDN